MSEPRVARTLAIAVLASMVGVYLLSRPWSAVAVLPVFALQLRYLVPRLERLRTPAATAVQAALTYTAVLPFEVTASMLGLLMAALLLDGAWRVAAAAAVSAVVIEAVRDGTADGTLGISITVALTCLVTYGLAGFVGRIEEVHAARLALAVSAVEEERLAMAATLDDGIGRALDRIARARPGGLGEVLATARESLGAVRSAAADLRGLSLAPEIAAARGLLASAGIEAAVRTGHNEPLGQAGTLLAAVLREAVTDVVRQGTARRCEIETAERGGMLVLRVAGDGERTAERAAAALDDLAARVAEVGGRLTAGLEPDGRFAVTAQVTATEPPCPAGGREHRLSLALLATVLTGLSVKGLLLMSAAQALAAVPLLAACCALILWPRGRWTLLPLALLCYLPLIWFKEAWGGTPGYLAGALLVLLPAAAAWPLVGAVLVSMGVIAWAAGAGAPLVANSVISALVTGLVVYGLVRPAQLADELRAASAGLARAAVVQERLRAARDLHDLLGHTFAAVLLKGELARRLERSDPARAAREFADMVAMAVRARADMDALTCTAPRLDLDAELASARSVLEAAGIEVRVARDGDPPAAAATVLGAVLREAVTNVLRHSAARHCEITVRADGLSVANDGAPARVAPPGSGIGNLRTRLAAAGGRLEAGRDGDRFRLTARLDPAGLAGDADGVGAAAGVQLGDDRR
ncbi:sensor histidine kinase [Actinomadura macrotermitis]|uniref:Signal transduction histidine kinase subgroup 3 dimerisation and phosphoacceptor domain-containing protein n=1 Tax=Actinomadura macrotermitis TaxID=2585200 RepID=A0A7K0BXB0_9ACTN|nr:histidine kinase [Actinomadura macrotermitis]MQY05818.1 hypothetical protein [Actinomadura macrotermitis]